MGQFDIRFAKSADARGILEARYSAVHETAARDYAAEILDLWAPPVTAEQVETYAKGALLHETTLVAEVEGQVVGFGVIVESNNELRAIYVSNKFGTKGVGSALLHGLERLAKEQGCKELKMDASLTAEPFYRRHGFREIERGDHTFSSGGKMACVKMRKALY